MNSFQYDGLRNGLQEVADRLDTLIAEQRRTNELLGIIMVNAAPVTYKVNDDGSFEAIEDAPRQKPKKAK